ncbi:hypothetical protein RRG08_013646 [Elysia crispata]|uniref:Uncharacterized protein n=1 Tax=Elysia crispata TaxID=231223 RepID=A0AAE1A2Z9_9GAST|nr:hypothetical protein RRG08_013646 [Elysia crispata]
MYSKVVVKREWKEKRDMVINEIRLRRDSRRVQKAVQQAEQWTNWDNALQKSLTWNDLWHMVPLRISFLIRSVRDLLPSNANLVRFHTTDNDGANSSIRKQSGKDKGEKYLNLTKELEDASYKAVVMPVVDQYSAGISNPSRDEGKGSNPGAVQKKKKKITGRHLGVMTWVWPGPLRVSEV